MLSPLQSLSKRSLDVFAAGIGLALTWWVIAAAAALARLDTGASGIFRQERVGLGGRRFTLLKIRSMRTIVGAHSTVTTLSDSRITPIGRILRRSKIDELPQLWNVLVGEMSLVGPRPDVPEYVDSLTGADKFVLTVRPGITGPATLKYRNEELILDSVPDPVAYNRDVIWPDKVRINRDYISNYSFSRDFFYIFATVFGLEVTSGTLDDSHRKSS